MNRLAEGHFLIPNPRNPNRLGRIDLSPENMDCIAFWTKNPYQSEPAESPGRQRCFVWPIIKQRMGRLHRGRNAVF